MFGVCREISTFLHSWLSPVLNHTHNTQQLSKMRNWFVSSDKYWFTLYITIESNVAEYVICHVPGGILEIASQLLSSILSSVKSDRQRLISLPSFLFVKLKDIPDHSNIPPINNFEDSRNPKKSVVCMFVCLLVEIPSGVKLGRFSHGKSTRKHVRQ